jgi:hypothetical protein
MVSVGPAWRTLRHPNFTAAQREPCIDRVERVAHRCHGLGHEPAADEQACHRVNASPSNCAMRSASGSELDAGGGCSV